MLGLLAVFTLSLPYVVVSTSTSLRREANSAHIVIIFMYCQWGKKHSYNKYAGTIVMVIILRVSQCTKYPCANVLAPFK